MIDLTVSESSNPIGCDDIARKLAVLFSTSVGNKLDSFSWTHYVSCCIFPQNM